MKVTPEEKFKVFASRLQQLYEDKSTQCIRFTKEAARHFKPFKDIFKSKSSEEYLVLVKETILKPIISIEDALLYTYEILEKKKRELEGYAAHCTEEGLVDEVNKQLKPLKEKFETQVENGLDLIDTYKFELFDYLGIDYNKEETV